MIERYTRPAMGRIWTLENRYRAWLAVEVAVCEAWAELGRVPAEAVKTIREKADFELDRILDLEETTKHDVIAFLTAVEEQVGHEVATRSGKWVVWWYDVRALDDLDGGYMDSHFLKPAELATPEDLKASPRGYGFHNKDAAQALADLLNTKEANDE